MKPKYSKMTIRLTLPKLKISGIKLQTKKAIFC
jgi:hypothetical protein